MAEDLEKICSKEKKQDVSVPNEKYNNPTLWRGIKSAGVLAPSLMSGGVLGIYGRIRNKFYNEEGIHVSSNIQHYTNSLNIYCRLMEIGLGIKLSKFIGKIYETCFGKFIYNGNGKDKFLELKNSNCMQFQKH